MQVAKRWCLSGEDVVVLGQIRGRIDAAGIEVGSPHGQIWTFRAGQWFERRSVG
jgi:hypothetical protein